MPDKKTVGRGNLKNRLAVSLEIVFSSFSLRKSISTAVSEPAGNIPTIFLSSPKCVVETRWLRSLREHSRSLWD
ncbi:hypothetical protein BOX24_00065 [Leptospirillum ferriphilum]|uniref:Uncharacterized protein n=2 Tax=Leptospirillum ferriphilum TaxID=178606 RepID=A0A059XX05_9BACT|nr:hypothetical protein Y981_01650 [Leptospirillum ferriphilum YSK]OOH75249.1 hypothetical protein BOX24_00065 [Leptospirillum ferriphilum]